jgi:hypothetical protein
VVKLTPFSEETLDHVIHLERPRGVRGRDGEGFDEQQYKREEAYHGLMPSVQDYATVGDLYEALRTNLTSCAARLGEQQLFIGPAVAQVEGDAVGVDNVATISDLAGALRAIDVIVEQGEGSPGDREDSHYARFRSIREEYGELLAANPSFEPAWPVAANPVMRRPPEPEDKVFVDHPSAAPVLDYANAVYSALLRLLVQAFGRQTADAAVVQRQHLDAAIELMHLLGKLGSLLATLPASDAVPGVHAGLTFTMLRSVDPLLVGKAERHLIDERLTGLANEAEHLARLQRLPPEIAAGIGRARKVLGFGSRAD